MDEMSRILLLVLFLPMAVFGARASHAASTECAMAERSAHAEHADGEPMAEACEGCGEEMAPLASGLAPAQASTGGTFPPDPFLDVDSAAYGRIEYPPEPLR